MPDIQLDLSEPEYQRLLKAAALQGKSITDFAEQAMSTEISRRYTLPSSGGRVVTFQLPKRAK